MNNIQTMTMKNALFCKDKKGIKELYIDAFPKKERMPFWLMLLLSHFLTTKFFVFYNNNTLCGLIYMGKIGRQAFIMFFAVDRKQRSLGYGSRILQMIRNKYPKCKIVVSIEPCIENTLNYELSLRRKNFYIRNGFKDSGYNIKLNGINQEILVNGIRFSKFSFSVFLIAYSCFAIIPNIYKRKD